MTAFGVWRDGIRRVVSAPSLLVAVWALTTAVSLSLTLAIRGDIVNSLGRSLDADSAAHGMNYEWMQEFAGQAPGLATTFRPTIVGFAAVLDNLSAYVDNVQRPAVVAAASGAYVLAWVFLSGGIISRYASDRAAPIPGFLSACRAYFFRFFRLALITAVVYGLIFGALHPWLFTILYPRLTAGIALERDAFAIRAGLYALFVLLLACANIVFDYARVRAVVEDRRSMLFALVASWRFLRNNPGGAVGVYVLNVILFAVTLAAYAFLAPPGGGVGVMAWAAFVIGQAYITARLGVRLIFWASETAMVMSAPKRSPHVGGAGLSGPPVQA
jgi:hypothetical protein